MYSYDELERDFVEERVEKLKDKVERRIQGEMKEEKLKKLRMMKGI